MPTIFMSYRRRDSAGQAGRIYDRLQGVYGAGSIFRDVDDIGAGADFVTALQDAIARCDVVLVVIGPDWLTATGGEGRRRLDEPEDVVRIELMAALADPGIRVIPVLVGGATMPSAPELPGELAGLARRNAVEIRDTRAFDGDVDNLVADIGAPAGTRRRISPVWIAAAAAMVVVAAIGIVALLARGSEEPEAAVSTTVDPPPTASSQTTAPTTPPTTTAVTAPPTTTARPALAVTTDASTAGRPGTTVSYTFFQPIDTLPTPPSDCLQFHAWALENGGIPNYLEIAVTVQQLDDSVSVAINELDIIPEPLEVDRGTAVRVNCPSLSMGLIEPISVRSVVTATSATTEYFVDHESVPVLALTSSGDAGAGILILLATADDCVCEFNGVLRAIVDGVEQPVAIDRDGEPFVVAELGDIPALSWSGEQWVDYFDYGE